MKKNRKKHGWTRGPKSYHGDTRMRCCTKKTALFNTWRKTGCMGEKESIIVLKLISSVTLG